MSASTSPAVPAEPSRRVTGSPNRSAAAAEAGSTRAGPPPLATW
ncbi:MAG TPA: hypothetical protein VKU77_30580 [Streptosporangiaceae bacterium]|nr:hypothetical protein [Streptosporangiaceae bacterium]